MYITLKMEVNIMSKNRGKEIKSKVWEVVTQERTPEELALIAEEYKSINRYAFVLHDKDTIKLEDTKPERLKELIEQETTRTYSNEADFWVEDGGVKHINNKYWEMVEKSFNDQKEIPVKTHAQGVIELPDNYMTAKTLAKWFNLPETCFRAKFTGKGGSITDTLLDCTRYLTHESEKEQASGKHLYPDDEIISNWNWRAALDVRLNERLMYGKNLSDRERLRFDVLYKGLTLKQARDKDPYHYEKDMQLLKRNRGDYLANQKPPQGRITFYIYGKGGTGKDLLARAIARGLYPQYEEDDAIFFELGAKGAEFEGYDGQPVMLWSDVRAPELLNRWGRGNLLNILDPYPKANKKQNVKYSSLGLLNEVNILTGPDDYQMFLSNLMGGYEDKNGNKYEAENIEQITRRVPVIIPVRQDDFDILINSGVANGTSDFGQYYHHKRVQGSLYRAHQILSNAEKLQEVEGKIALPVIDVARSIKPVKEIGGLLELDEFESYGEEKKVSEFEREIMAMTSDELKWLVNDLMSELQNIQRDDDFFMYELNEKRKQEINEQLRMIRALNRDISD